MSDKPLSVPVPLWLPSDRAWLDPRLVARNLYVQITDVTLAMGAVSPLLPINYDRWAVGFVIGPGMGTTFKVGPWSDVSDNTGWGILSASPVWFKQIDYGPLIGSSWFGFASSAGVARVVEIIRLT